MRRTLVGYLPIAMIPLPFVHSGEVLEPPLPPGRAVELPGRGTTFVCEQPGPPDAPVVMLLHGLSGTADLNWYPAFGPLSRHARVIALDHRGHGGGIRTSARFRLADCADDAVALADVLGIDRFVAVGYSMGGPIAQLIWHRHHERVDGLVLAATSRNFRGRPRDQLLFLTLPAVSIGARAVRVRAFRSVAEQWLVGRSGDPRLRGWAQREMRRHDLRLLFEAAEALGRFSSHEWVGDIDVPTAVIVTTRDQLVPPHRQLKLAQSIPDAVARFVDGDHYAVVREPDRFVPALVRAVRHVARPQRGLRVADYVPSYWELASGERDAG